MQELPLLFELTGFGSVSAIFVASSWMCAAHGLVPGRYLFIKSQSQLCAVIDPLPEGCSTETP